LNVLRKQINEHAEMSATCCLEKNMMRTTNQHVGPKINSLFFLTMNQTITFLLYFSFSTLVDC